MPSTRDIKRRIKLIQTTSQITRAMELVAATKMKRAEAEARGSQPYSARGRKILRALMEHSDTDVSPFLKTNEKGKILVLIITPDRGLCGALAGNVVREANLLLSKYDKEEIDVMTIGKLGQDTFRRQGFNIIATATHLDWKPKIFDIRPFAKIALDGYFAEKYRRVYLIFNHFISSSSTRPAIRWLFPFSPVESEDAEFLQKIEPFPLGPKEDTHASESFEYLFEPSPAKVLPFIIRNLVEMEMYQALLDSNASEHSARMIAMHSATENAKELVDDLSLTFNQMRQEGITRELAEISASNA
ncbi:MAG: ATP synthase F1 subunit gamma [Candidatus Parcubacteria bacterium]|nr:ATP synthase F1 subunit gamma [Candidatus Parcubacteria bacterium]